MFKKTILGVAVLGQVLSSLSALSVKNNLDLKGNGTFTEVELPFTYFNKQRGDKFTLIHQGGYKVYDVQKNSQEVAVLGPLNPCIAVVATDGKKMVAFHKHSTNALQNMKTVLEENLDTGQKTTWLARIFSAKDDFLWETNKRSLMHNGKTHTQAVKHIKDYLADMGMERHQITASLYPLRPNATSPLHYEDGQLGRYDLAECCAAVRLNELFEETGGKKQIKFTSIDPFQEDIFGYSGTNITQAELQNVPTSKQRQNTPASERVVPYDLIPQLVKQQMGIEDGFRYQRGICERRMNQEENEHYQAFFGKSAQQVMDAQYDGKNNGYDSLAFFQL